jgi:predicted DCC family thiol-disulfide oxidoreductase YuxK
MQTVVFFDGLCNLCNGAVQFVIKHDTKNVFKFASLQSDYAQKELLAYKIDLTAPNSFVLIIEGEVYQQSTAALKVVKQLNGLWPLLYVGIFLPRFFRDWIYGFVAKNRYKWFGKKEICWTPTADLKHKFLA